MRGKEPSCQPSPLTPSCCHASQNQARRRPSVQWCRGPPPPPAWRARASPSAVPSLAWTWPPWTPSCTWTRWARSITAQGSRRGPPGIRTAGFETVTYMIDGILRHQDSNGGGGLITDGDTQWMTAGSGLIHIEAPPEEVVLKGGLFHGFQLWVNLPAKLKWNAPRYQDIRGRAVSLLSSPDGGALLRVIAGEVAGYQGPGVTYTPISLLHATLAPGAQLRLPWRPDFNALVYVLAGAGSVGTKRHPVRMGQLAVFGPGDVVTVAASASQESRSPQLEVLMLGGLPIREPVAAYGPFVMNTREELVQAFEDYQAGRLGTIPAVPAQPRPGHEVLNETTEPQ